MPLPWQGLEQSAEATIANLRGVPADRRNQNWSRDEINALVFLDLIGLIQKQAAGNPLTDQQIAALDLLRTSYQDHEKAVAARALTLYNTWADDPCHFQVPVGNDPGAYARTVANLCATPVGGLLTTPAPPSAEDFTGWARELVGDDFRRSLVAQVERFEPPLTGNTADAEVAREYQSTVAGIGKGFAFLNAADQVSLNAPAAEQPVATGEALDAVKEAAAEFGSERFLDVGVSALTTLSASELPFFFEEETTELADAAAPAAGSYQEAATALADILKGAPDISAEVLQSSFEAGLTVGSVILGAAAVITTEAIQVAQDNEVLPALQANQTKADAAPDLNALAKSSEGQQKLLNAFVEQLMPSYPLRSTRSPRRTAPRRRRRATTRCSTSVP